MWGHEYVITSLLENAVSWKVKRGGPPSVGVPSTFSSRPRSHAACPRHVVPSWQRQDGANLQGMAWERLPEGFFITKLRKFHCATCAVSKHTRLYRRSKRVKVAAAKRVKVAAAKRAPQAHTAQTHKRIGGLKARLWYSYQAVAVPRMSAYFRERTGSGKSSHRFLPLSQLF